jgi:hypothetical protein
MLRADSIFTNSGRKRSARSRGRDIEESDSAGVGRHSVRQATRLAHRFRRRRRAGRLADLVNLTGLIEELNEQARRSLAPQLTVTSHLTQAQSQLADLRRTLTHATEMLAFNISRPSPLLASV